MDIFHKIRKFDWYRTAMLISPHTAHQFDKMGRGGNPLHVALGARQVVPADIIYDLLEANPGAAAFADRAGKMRKIVILSRFVSLSVSLIQKASHIAALHYAAEYNSCEPEVFTAVLEAHPEAARHKNKWGQLPIHYATWRRAPPEIIRQLHEAYPEGAELTDTLAGFSAEQTILNTSLKSGEAEAATAS